MASTSEENFKGTTPLTFELSPGLHNIIIEIENDSIKEITSDENPYILEGPAFGFHETYKDGHLERSFFFKEYILEKSGNKPSTLIALFQPRDKSFEELNSIFPKGNNFNFDDSSMEKLLTEKEVPKSYIKQFIELLRRGGKVGIEIEKRTIIIEMIGKNSWILKEFLF